MLLVIIIIIITLITISDSQLGTSSWVSCRHLRLNTAQIELLISTPKITAPQCFLIVSTWHYQSSSRSGKIQSSFLSSFNLISCTQSFNRAFQAPTYIQNLPTSLYLHCCHLSPSQHNLWPGSILHTDANNLFKAVTQIMCLSCLKLFKGFLLNLY